MTEVINPLNNRGFRYDDPTAASAASTINDEDVNGGRNTIFHCYNSFQRLRVKSMAQYMKNNFVHKTELPELSLFFGGGGGSNNSSDPYQRDEDDDEDEDEYDEDEDEMVYEENPSRTSRHILHPIQQSNKQQKKQQPTPPSQKRAYQFNRDEDMKHLTHQDYISKHLYANSSIPNNSTIYQQQKNHQSIFEDYGANGSPMFSVNPKITSFENAYSRHVLLVDKMSAIYSKYGEANTSGAQDDSVPLDKDYEETMEDLRLIIKLITYLAKLNKVTRGDRGVRLEYHQRIPAMSAFAGFAQIRLGTAGVAKHRAELQELFGTRKFDIRQEVKFGRRTGKTFLAMFFIVMLLLTQRKCSGILMGISKSLARTNASFIKAMIVDILGDKNAPVKGKLEEAHLSDGIICVKSHHGTTNTVTCVTDPTRTNLRGFGNNKGFFMVDESDWIKEGAWKIVQPIWSMDIFVALYTSQAYMVSYASKMVENSILPGGKRVWRRYMIQPGRIALIESDDYATDTDKSDANYLFGNKNRVQTTLHGVSDTIRSAKRMWYNPVIDCLAKRFESIKLKEDEELKESIKKNRTNKADENSRFVSQRMQRYGRSATNDTEGSPVTSNGQPAYRDSDYMDEGEVEAFNSNSSNDSDEEDSMDVDTNSPEDILRKNQKINRRNYVKTLESKINQYDLDPKSSWDQGECVWLLTLPSHQPVKNMASLKASMTPETFRVEMLSVISETAYDVAPTFDADTVNQLFLPDNWAYNYKGELDKPIRWIIGLDPGAGGKSECAIVSALVFDSVREYDVRPDLPRHAIETINSTAMQQRIVITGIDIMTTNEALINTLCAERIMNHIGALRKEYKEDQYLNIPIWFVPELNMRHAAINIPIHLTDALIKFKEPYAQKPNLKMLHVLQNDGSKSPWAGITTTNGTKALSMTSLCARLMKGKGSIAISNRFITTTLDHDGRSHIKTDNILAKFKEQLISMRTIPPDINKREKCITYKGMGNDDIVFAFTMVDQGNIEIQRQIEHELRRNSNDDTA